MGINCKEWHLLKSNSKIKAKKRDIYAGVSAGCKTIFIDYEYAEKRPENFNHCTQSLAQAAQIILKNII
jgi:D-glycero-D-manno-heptose 1,7-bisphosphate phosphatase